MPEVYGVVYSYSNGVGSTGDGLGLISYERALSGSAYGYLHNTAAVLLAVWLELVS